MNLNCKNRMFTGLVWRLASPCTEAARCQLFYLSRSVPVGKRCPEGDGAHWSAAAPLHTTGVFFHQNLAKWSHVIFKRQTVPSHTDAHVSQLSFLLIWAWGCWGGQWVRTRRQMAVALSSLCLSSLQAPRIDDATSQGYAALSPLHQPTNSDIMKAA